MAEIDRQTWVILGDRLAEIRRLREQAEIEREQPVRLVFDSHDQARILGAEAVDAHADTLRRLAAS